MEYELLSWLRQRLATHPRLRLGIGDDAALVDITGSCVACTDTITDQVDFELQRCDPRRIGRKALAVNLSDLAAMAARPVAALVSLVLPRDGALALAQQLYEGLLPLAEEFELAIAGGDTNTWDGPLAVSVTALGELTARGPLRRSGGCVGDQLLVTGRLGGSILGKQFDFLPRIREALLLSEQYELHAAIDISDGLSCDLARLAGESRVGAILELDSIPIDEAAHRLAELRRDGITPLEHALSDGEDFELILAAPPDQSRRLLAEQPLTVPVSRIGELVESPGLWQVGPDGVRQPLPAQGYEH